MPYDFISQVVSATEMIHIFPGTYVLHNGIDGKIPATCCDVGSTERINVASEIPMPVPGFALLSRHGNIKRVVPQVVDPKALPDFHAFTDGIQNPLQGFRQDPVDFYINVFALLSEQ